MKFEYPEFGMRNQYFRCVIVARSPARPARPGWIRALLVLLIALAAGLFWFIPRPPAKYPVRCVVIGLDGLDPRLVRQFMGDGLLPNLKKLSEQGDFRELATSNPPQSPVAWSCFATGMNPGGTGIFDFVHRDPTKHAPLEAMATAHPAEPFRMLGMEFGPAVEVGTYRLPLKGDQVVLNRKGRPFWEYLDDRNIPATVLRLPSNFPPPPGKTRQLAGMGTPDITGTEGAYYFWTDQPGGGADSEGPGYVETIQLEGDRFTGRLYGPPNALKRPEKNRAPEPMAAEFTVSVDRRNESVRIRIGDAESVLRAGDWSDWLPVTFVMGEYFWGNPTGMIKFRLNKLTPHLELYGTPVQLDPIAPAMPISNPPAYAEELARRTGRMYTLGMPEDNKAFGSRIKALDETGFRQQCRQVLDDVWKTTAYELDRYRGGLFFTYFRTTDVVSHMMWWVMDPKHPMYDAELAELHGMAIRESYQWVDEKVGEIRRRVGEDALCLVMSDHGFQPFYREFMLNSWLADNGWLTLYPWSDRASAYLLDDVNWDKTRAYAVGLNGLYVNLEGREKFGSVPEKDRDQVVGELCAALERIHDPETGDRVVSKAYRREDVYSGEHTAEGPDIVVGYGRGYRSSGRSGQGFFPDALTATVDGKPTPTYCKPRMNRWSGDHCCDPALVPGVIFANRKLTKADPGLQDLAPTILQAFGIEKPQQMSGTAIFGEK